MDKKRLFVGQLVVYKITNSSRCELGEVAAITDHAVFVCYHEGETAAKTPCEILFQVVNSDMIDYSRLGGDRFNEKSIHKD